MKRIIIIALLMWIVYTGWALLALEPIIKLPF